MIRGPMMFGGAVPQPRLVETFNDRTSWRPDTGLALPGDLVCVLCPWTGGNWNAPIELTTESASAWTAEHIDGMLRKYLTAADMATTFTVDSAYDPFSVAVFRSVASIKEKRAGSVAAGSTVMAGFEKGDRHGAILVYTDIDPLSLLIGPTVAVGGVSMPFSTRSYSGPSGAQTTRNLHAYLYPDYPLYTDTATFTIDPGATYPAGVEIYELIGG